MEAKQEEKKQSALGAVGSLLVFAVGGWYFYGGGLEKHAAAEVDRIEQTVAADQLAQYEIAKRSGSPMDVCVQAGLVSAAYLQAQDEPSYAAAKANEKRDCKAAGIEQ